MFVHKQLAKGGYRLALTLQDIFEANEDVEEDNRCKSDSDCVAKIGPSCLKNQTPECMLEECYCVEREMFSVPQSLSNESLLQ